MNVEKKDLLALAEMMVSDPNFGSFTGKNGKTISFKGTVYESIVRYLQTLARIKPEASGEEVAAWLRLLPQSQLVRASSGLPEQFRQVLRLAFGLEEHGPARLRPELQQADLSDLIYYSGWLARLSLERTKEIYEKLPGSLPHQEGARQVQHKGKKGHRDGGKRSSGNKGVENRGDPASSGTLKTSDLAKLAALKAALTPK